MLEMLKEEKAVSELASAYGVYPTILHRWKKQVVADLPQLFERDQDARAAQEAYERRIEELYTEIGRLSTQLAWLKKKVSTLTHHIAITEKTAQYGCHTAALAHLRQYKC